MMFLKAIRIVNIKVTPHGLQLKISKRDLSRYVCGLTPNNIQVTPPWRVLFFGTDEFAAEHLKALNENCLADDGKVVKSLQVVTPSIDKCAVGNYAKDNNLMHFKWPLPKTLDEYDVGVVVSFGHLIPKRLIDAFPYGILNVHPSILPRWRGASPIVHTILNGDQETGVSIMEIRPIHFDVGPLLMQSKYPVPNECTTYQLRDYLASCGSNMLLHALRELPTLEKLEYEQTSEGVTYAHRMSSKNAVVNWKKQTTIEIDRQYRALSEIFGLRSMWNGHRVRLMEKLSVDEMNGDEIQQQLCRDLQHQGVNQQPGFVHYMNSKQVLCIKCLDGWTGFKRIVLKKSLTAKMFHNGYLSKPEFSSVPFKSQENELHKFQYKARLTLNPSKSRQFI